MFVNWNVIRHKQNWHNKTLKVSYNLAFVLSTIIMASEWSQHQFSINCMMIHLRGAIITMDLPFSPFNINRLDTNKYRYLISSYFFRPWIVSVRTFMYCDLSPYVRWPLDFQIQKRIVSVETIWRNTGLSLKTDSRKKRQFTKSETSLHIYI